VTLTEFIEANIERLLAEWQSFAETLPPAIGMDMQSLRGGAEAMIRAVAQDVESSQSAEHQREKSRGNRPETSPNLTKTAQAHAAERLAVNFTLDQLVSEYRALRASVISLWSSSIEKADQENLHELTRFNEAMDQSLTEAIQWFNSRLEHSREIFVGILGHDLRDPLSTILINAQLPLVTDDPEQIRDAAARTRRSANRMREMVDVLLDFSRTRLGERIPLSPATTDLADICKTVAQDFESSHPDNKIKVKCTGKTIGEWDEGRIYQALSNLMRNALEYGKRNGTVTVACKGKSDEFLLSVHNEGRPISLAKQQEIFEPMKRGEREDEGRRASNGGIGLGLYIVKQIATAHGGTVELSSNAKAGTTFTVRLPRRRAA
jgi:signal transduction histidine kinase